MGTVGVWGLLAEAPARSETLEGPWRPLTEQGGRAVGHSGEVGLPVGGRPRSKLGCRCSRWSSSGFGGLAVLFNE